MQAPIPACKKDEKIKYIFCFTVSPDYQRQGVAMKLLEYVCNDAKAEGYDCIEVSTQREFAHDGFTGIYEMYFKCGFEICAEKNGKIVMRRKL